MFYSCPHCRELVATDRQTRLPPALCPRCGGVLREPDAPTEVPSSSVDGGLSFASFLRGDETDATEAPATGAPPPASAPASASVADPAPARQPEVQDAGTATHAESAIPGTVDERAAIEPDSAAPAPFLPPHTFSPAPSAFDSHAPSFMRRPASTATPAHVSKWQWMAVLVLATLLLVQVLVADRARLAAEAGWRPLIITLCDALGCSVPAWHQPGAISMLSRDVSPIAGSNGGLDVRATFRTDARWAQRWPVLLLSLSDADGRVLGSRAFLPGEYLGADTTQTELAPGQSARVTLKLQEPDPGVVAFSFDFR